MCGLVFAAEEAAVSAAGADASALVEDEAAMQLRIYRDALRQGASDSIRLDAAMGLLVRDDELCRQTLLETLTAADNPMAQSAVCRALIKGRGVGATAASKEYFSPLIAAVKSPDPVLARLAADALLMYDYQDAGAALAQIAHDGTLEKAVRLNSIYALQLRPEADAIKELIGLLNDLDADVIRAAELALQEVYGLPLGTKLAVWENIQKELDKKSPTEIRRERLVRQEMRLREALLERDQWQKLYLGSLDKEYEQTVVSARGLYLLDKLNSGNVEIRVWALEKLRLSPVESMSNLSEKLLSMLSDENRRVRFMTARVLTTMSALNPAEKLLEQYNKETDPQVALALFEALGEACFFAFSPGSKLDVSAQIKTQTFTLAKFYTTQSDPEMARRGAEVLRKMLELGGLTTSETQEYLKAIAGRYQQEFQKKGAIRGDLLVIMAKLCGTGFPKNEASKLYRDSFEEALLSGDDNSQVRQAAAMGLVNVDKISALATFKKINLIADSSPSVTQIAAEIVGEVGTPDDITWLMSLPKANGQTELVGNSILSILKRAELDEVLVWASQIEKMDENAADKDNVSDVLKVAEEKAIAIADKKQIIHIQYKILERLSNMGDYDQSILYWKKLSESLNGDWKSLELAKGAEMAVEAFLLAKQMENASNLIIEMAKNGQIKPDSLTISRIDSFVRSESVSNTDKLSLLISLSSFGYPAGADWWPARLADWRSLTEEVSEPNAAN